MTKETRIHTEGKTVSSISCAGKTWQLHGNEWNLEHSLIPYTKINSKWITDLNLRPDTIKLLEENTLTFSSVQSLSHVRLFETPWIAARQASLSITNSWSSLKLMSIESIMPSSRLILCHPLLLPPIPPSIRVFSNESSLEVAKVLEFQLQHQSFQWTPRTDLL